MKCVICGIELDTISEAINQGWVPNFYESEMEHGPACPSCTEAMLYMDEDGEMSLKPEYRGRIQYADGDYDSSQDESDDLMIGIAITEEKEEEIH
jgi:hypothetical protein